jgi:hypothetical protein
MLHTNGKLFWFWFHFNISNNAAYSDVSTNVLTLTSSAPSTFNGYIE